ncbi:MAG: hypothetical protein HRU25_13275 [Psychrobium sp.]|nr:hypothetical protein [Psychrobium sp.]
MVSFTKIWVLSISSSLLLISGCVSAPTTQISAFANATTAITERIDAVIEEYNNTALNRQFISYASSYQGEHAQHFSSDELAKIEKPVTVKLQQSLAIYRANKSLGQYSNSLSLLATSDSRIDIDVAATNLYGAMTSLNAQYKTIKETDEDLFDTENFAMASTLIAEIGSVIIEEKRRLAIKKIVIAANDKVAVVCDEINNQLKIAGIENNISASRQYILTEEVKEYKSRAKRRTKLAWRASEIKRLYELQQAVFNSKLLIQNSQKAILAVKEAHQVLTKELQNDKFTSASITLAIGRLKELDSHYDDFEGLLLSCNNISKNENGVLSCDDK